MFLRSGKSRRCVEEKCKRKWQRVCSCCQKKLCEEHCRIHEDLNNPQLNPLIHQMNLFDQRLNGSALLGRSREELDQWRDKSMKTVDDFYRSKTDELQRCVETKLDEQRKEFEQIRVELTELIQREEKNEEQQTIERLQSQLTQMEQTFFQVQIRPLLIDAHSITIEESNRADSSALTSLTKIDRTITCEGEWGPGLASNSRYLLIDRHPHLCLIDSTSRIVKEIPWKFDFIRDMSWSLTLNGFLIITRHRELYLVNEKSLSIELIQNIEEQDWSSCTCSETSLYLTARREGTNLFQYDLLSSFALTKRWKPPQSCKSYEQILSSTYQNCKLALVISHVATHQVHFEVRLATTLDRICSLSLDLSHSLGQPFIRCSTFTADQWLIIDNHTSQLFQISADGRTERVVTLDTSPWNARLFTSHLLAVRTKNSVDFFKL